MTRPRVTAFITLAAILSDNISSRAIADSTTKESWLGMYMNGKKIGYSNTLIEPSSYQGKSCLKITSHSVTRLELFGKQVSQDSDFTIFTDSTYNPIHQDVKIESNGSALGFRAD